MIECPKCHEQLAFASHVPDEQVMVMELQYENDYLAAATLGGTITNMEQLLAAIAKDAGTPVHVYVKSIEYGDHKARIAFLVIAQHSSAGADRG